MAVWLLALLAWSTLHWLILPRLDEWRPRVEVLATQALGHPVQIGRLATQGGGWLPSFLLQDVVLRDPAGHEALRLPRVQAALSVPSLLALQLRFAQLLIEDARLDVRRDAAGRLYVGGLPLGSASPTLAGDGSADWLFSQHEILVRGGTLRWLDEQRAAPPLALADVQLLLRNRGRRHELRLEATPPADWGDRFTIVGQARGALLSRPGDWRRWKGTLHASLPRADVAQLRHHVTLPVDLQQGRAALRAWVDWDQGQPQALTLDAVLRGVSVQLGRDLEPVAVAGLSGRLVAERQGNGAKLALQGLGFTLPDGATWAPSQLALQWRSSAAAGLAAAAAAEPASQPASQQWLPPLDGGQLTADRLDLPLLAQLAERLPIGSGLRELLRQLEPEGTVTALDARWDGPLDQPRSWSAKAGVQGLAIAAAASPEPGGIGRPGWRGADLQITANQAGGQADLKLNDGQLTLPGVFDEAVVPLTRFGARLEWALTPAAQGDGLPTVQLKVRNASFDNADARGSLEATWQTGAGTGFGKGGRLPGVLQLEGRLAEGRATQVARYLPLGIGMESRLWTQRAVRGGSLHDVSFRVQGDLWDFPFVNKRDGDFRITGQLKDVTLAPVPSVPPGSGEPAWDSPWPTFANISGELVFERDSMRFSKTRGTLWGLALDEVSGGIRALSAEPTVLEVDGQVRGPLADLLRAVRGTPVSDATGRLLDATTASGNADLKLGLTVPLGRSAEAQLRAVLQLPGNDVRLRPDLPLLGHARGRIEATHKGVVIAGLRAQLLGGEAVLDGGSQPDGSLKLTVSGLASAEALRRATELGPAVPRLAQRLQGQASYRLQSSLLNGQTDWALASNLQGMAIDLPAPLGKPAEQALALRVSSAPDVRASSASDSRASTTAPPRDWLRLELGPLRAQALVESTATGLRPLRSAWSWEAPLPEPVAGGRAVLALARLDADAWRGALAGVPAAAAAAADDSAWLPQTLQLTTPELLLAGRRLSGVVLDLQRQPATAAEAGDTWRAQFKSDQAAGTLDYREARQASAPGRLRAQLARLSLPDEVAGPAGSDPVAQIVDRAGQVLPAVDLEVADFELRGRKLGSLVLQAANRPATGDAAGRTEWQVTRLRLKNDDATLIADGRWEAVPGQARRRMVLAFELDVANGGALLERLGFGKVLRGASGKLAGTLGWDGSPLAFDLPSLGGRLALDMQGGQFLQMDPGAARLLGVMSLQALPRRLLLDFRDVFQQGFAFDTATASLLITRGVASTENLRLRGLQALVAMAGTADIGRETQDLHVVVVPELNAGSASLAYAAVNPAVGLGAFVGQWLLREPLRQASAREFRITGHWDAPKVDRLERGLLDPLPPSASARADNASAASVAPAGQAKP
ncbi:DUF3971 domain-containing protein [Rubrivivax pictus]|uniref:DUF3971 domain-containing protein n=1 Tax=Pseudaquabacterium pictum TaxID=2315236 RepID=A0A480B0F3_9BURK|nr:DUF3971 domain-containing protein [Rubrivivax pictus]